MAMGRDHCRWVIARLPLLAGGELLGLDRRRVERHLLSCPGCRRRLQALATTLDHLHVTGQSQPAGLASQPSLWPLLAQQIRESRREAGLNGAAPRWSWALRASLAASVFALVTAAGFGLYHFNRKTQVIVRPWPPVIALRPRPVVRSVSFRREIPPVDSTSQSTLTATSPTSIPEAHAPVGTTN